MNQEEQHLKHSRVHEIRQEILDAVGVDHGDPFETTSRGIRKANLIVVASELQPESVTVNYADARLTDIYTYLGKWLDVGHEANAGKDWTMNRDLLKEIHRQLHE